jgi:hypothetical protein
MPQLLFQHQVQILSFNRLGLLLVAALEAHAKQQELTKQSTHEMAVQVVELVEVTQQEDREQAVRGLQVGTNRVMAVRAVAVLEQ